MAVKNKGVIDAYIDALINKKKKKRTDSQDNTHRSISYENGTWSINIYYNYINGDNDLEGVQFSYCPDVID
jgi:predicted alpha-1,6-mannanase (GH76 family)